MSALQPQICQSDDDYRATDVKYCEDSTFLLFSTNIDLTIKQSMNSAHDIFLNLVH